MDAQLKKGVLDVCVLAVIRKEETYGYQIIKEIKPILDLSESTLYTILKRLEEQKMITVRQTMHEGRVRKYYKITDVGVKRIYDFLKEWEEIKEVYTFIIREALWLR